MYPTRKIPGLATLAAVVLCGALHLPSRAERVVDGVTLADTAVVGGQKLQLNGAGFRKRGYFKTDVSAIYTAQPANSLEALTKMPGAKRIHLYLLKDIPGATISRYFISDFKLVSTEAEFKQLINEIGLVGAMYGSVGQVRRGDVVTGDWIPGKGFTVAVNGKTLPPSPDASPYINSELLFQIFLRMYVGPAVPEELRLNLLGLSKSMESAVVQGER